MTRNVKDAVLALNDFAIDRLTGRLEGLTDRELHWSPVAECWDVRQSEQGRWVIDGDGGGPPWSGTGPPPMTTIAWRVGHLALSLLGFGGQLFEDYDLAVADVDFPAAASEVVPWLEDAYRRCWRDPLSARAEPQVVDHATSPQAAKSSGARAETARRNRWATIDVVTS